MINTIKYNSRAILYAFIISIGFVFLMTIESSNNSFFMASVGILYLIVLFEMFYIWFVSKEKLKQFDLPLVSGYTRLKEFLNHLLLPSFMYFSLAGFIYFNNTNSVQLFLVILAFFAFTALFINLKAFYLDKYTLEKSTYFVYDMIEMLLYFTTTNVILSVAGLNNYGIIVVSTLVFLLTTFVLVLNLYQFDKLDVKSVALVIVLSTFASFNIVASIGIFRLNNISANIMQFMVYYLLFGTLRHKLEGTLTSQIFFEYLSVFLLSLALLIGSTSA